MRLQRLLDLADAPDAASFERQLVEIGQEMDFGVVTGLAVAKLPDGMVNAVRIGNTPAAFQAAFKDDDTSERDPVLRRVKRLSVPVIYDQALYVREDAADLWEQQAPFGYRTGIAVALHLPGARHFVLGLDREKPLPDDETRLTRLLADLQLLAVHAQEPAMRLFLQPAGGVSLTAREQQILRMTNEGMSAKRIADLLNCATGTVNFHLQSARVKLGVHTKHQAARKAMALGLL